MRRGVILYADSLEELERSLSKIQSRLPVAVFSDRNLPVPSRVCFFRRRRHRNWDADLAAVRAAYPALSWSRCAGQPVTFSSGSSSLAVIVSHFNWAGYEMPVRNLRRFCRQMRRDGVAVYGEEVYLSGSTPAMKDQAGWRCREVGENAILWQKEALFNLAVQRLPAEIEIVALLDPDIFFTNSDWVADTAKALEKSPVVQVFETAEWTDRAGAVFKRRTAAGKRGLDVKSWTTHPGFGWAFRREVYDAFGGWYPFSALGGGDLALAVTVTSDCSNGPTWERVVGDLGPKNRALFTSWVERVRREMSGSLAGFVPGTVVHEWHGERKDRRYQERPQLLKDFSASQHLETHEQGHLVWSSKAPKSLRRNIANYFEMRKEDG